MPNPSPQEIEKLFLDLQSKLFHLRKAAAAKLNDLEFAPADYPQIDPPKLVAFKEAVKAATATATDPRVIKQALSVGNLLPGFIPLLICMVLAMAGVMRIEILGMPLGAPLFGAATIFLGYWYFHSLTNGLKAQTAPASQAAALAREIGILPK